MWFRWRISLLELVYRSVLLSRMLRLIIILIIFNLSISDAPDLQGSSFFKDSDPKSGLGGWGDPSRDFEVPTGGFSNFHLSYPSSHILRRNFTLQPYLNINSSLFPNPQLMANATFTKAEVRKMVDGFTGDFKGFQKYMENFEVQSSTLPKVFLALIDKFLRVRTVAFMKLWEGRYLIFIGCTQDEYF
jgi:hypothetical protein